MNDDRYLLKLKLSGMTDKDIASKLGVTVEEVNKRHKELIEAAAAQMKSGITEFEQTILNLTYQFQLMGQTLQVVSDAVTNQMSAEEVNQVLAAIAKDMGKKWPTKEITKRLLSCCIILKPFTPPPLEKAIEALTIKE